MQLGLAPSEFWKMSPDEVSFWYNVNRPKPKIANMTEEEAQALTDMINENPEEFD